MRELQASLDSIFSLKSLTFPVFYEDSSLSRGLATLIVINLATVVLGTLESLRESAGGLSYAIEVISVLVFTVESPRGRRCGQRIRITRIP